MLQLVDFGPLHYVPLKLDMMVTCVCVLQAAGINGFLYYGPQVLEKAGVGALLSNLGFNATSASLLVNVVITFCMLPCIALSMKLMDIAGRRYIYDLLFYL